LTRELMRRFNNDAYAVVAWSERATATEYASFAPRVLQHAEEGDVTAMRIVTGAARQVGRLVRRLIGFGAPHVALLGGLAAPRKAWLDGEVREVLVPAEHDAVAGALLLARREASGMRRHEARAHAFGAV
jgi:glucosamine kinase